MTSRTPLAMRVSRFSIRERHRYVPKTATPGCSERMYSARWLPANPVIPVMRTRIARQISKDRAFGRLPGLRPRAAVARSQSDAATERRIDVTRLLCGRWEFGTRAAPPAPGAAGRAELRRAGPGVLCAHRSEVYVGVVCGKGFPLTAARRRDECWH